MIKLERSMQGKDPKLDEFLNVEHSQDAEKNALKERLQNAEAMSVQALKTKNEANRHWRQNEAH